MSPHLNATIGLPDNVGRVWVGEGETGTSGGIGWNVTGVWDGGAFSTNEPYPRQCSNYNRTGMIHRCT